MIRRYALRDDQWERIENLLPGREDTGGVTPAACCGVVYLKSIEKRH